MLRMPPQQDAENFATLFSGKRKRARAATMDKVLHAERLDGKAKRTHRRAIDDLPDGAMIALEGEAFAVRGESVCCAGRRKAMRVRNAARAGSKSTF